MDKYKNLVESMGKHAQAAYPTEAVGIITKDYKYIPCKNVSSDPINTFILDPAALIIHDGNIWGIFHSHPGSEQPYPSKEDKESASLSNYRFLVGFGDKFYTYWLDSAVNALKFEPFERKHLVS